MTRVSGAAPTKGEGKIDKTFYRISTGISVARAVLVVSLYLAIGVAALVTDSNVGYALAALPLAFAQQFFFNALHYCTHSTFVRSRAINNVLGIAFGCLSIMNFALYKPYHLQHHRHLGTDQDPEPHPRSFATRAQYLREMLMPHFFIDNWMSSLKTLTRSLGLAWFGSHERYLLHVSRVSVNFNSFLLFVWVSALLGLTLMYGRQVFWLYWVPLGLSYVLANLVILPEHYRTDPVLGRNLENSRTVSAGAFARFFIVNMNFHAEHHLYPGVPFHNLSQLNRRIGSGVKHRDQSFFAFHRDVFRSLPWKKHREA